MSYIFYDPDEWRVEITNVPCPCKGKCNGCCTGSTSYVNVRRDPEEVAEIKRLKRLRHEEDVLKEAALIRLSRRVARRKALEGPDGLSPVAEPLPGRE